MATKKWVYDFAEGNARMSKLLGGKGANLAEMASAGYPVPPGFTITTEACREYFRTGRSLSGETSRQIEQAMRRLEARTGRRFGDPAAPLLVSVRSGSVASMPGMMDTILNLGLNDETVQGLAEATGDEGFAYDCYRRLLQMFGSVVLGVEERRFERVLERELRCFGAAHEQLMPAEGWRTVVEQYKRCIERESSAPFPQQVDRQLSLAVEAVFRSWHHPRAKLYREAHKISEEQGTAVNIQCMVFGNAGGTSGTGVVFTRNPSTGEKGMYGEFLLIAQGEDVVAGVRTPQPIAAMQEALPEAYDELTQVCAELEARYQDMQDIEFTVEKGTLYLLQTRSGKRNAQAALKIAVSMVEEGVISRETALNRIDPAHLDKLLHRRLDETAAAEAIASGLPASPGAAVGRAVFDSGRAAERRKSGEPVILVRAETTPEDIQGLLASEGVLTARGGMTSHAAVVARGMGKPCICGCEAIRIDEGRRLMTIGDRVVEESAWITLDGGAGKVILGAVPLREAEMSEQLRTVLAWADSIRALRVYANADTPEDARAARALGAEGIGLCRTEHMFFAPSRLPLMQRMILADSAEERKSALERLLPMQRADFEGLFEAMDGLPVTIRLLDPPLHEFLPQPEALERRLSETASPQERERLERWTRRAESLREANPMLGHRGCRLGIVHPEIYDMQIEAVFRAALACLDRGIAAKPRLMIPFVGDASELKLMRELIDSIAAQVIPQDRRGECRYEVGTMIELPRAALTAGAIAPHADFFSFGTNDLTQMTFGFSRDDAEGTFLPVYLEKKMLPHNPFQVLDADGVGRLVEIAVAAGRARRPSLAAGVCGEHGGDPASIGLCHRLGLDSVSCSPYRIPAARMAAAQAAIASREADNEGNRAAQA